MTDPSRPAPDAAIDLIETSIARLLSDHTDGWVRMPADAWAEATWSALTGMGVPFALLDEADGGFGLACADALRIVRLAGAAAVPLPIAESMLGRHLLGLAGIAQPAGIVTVALSGSFDFAPEHPEALRGCAHHVPWARHADWIVIPAAQGPDTVICLVARAALRIHQDSNLAAEPRDTLTAEPLAEPMATGFPVTLRNVQPLAMGAALRCQAMAGAIERVVDMSVRHARERIQFGRPIGDFQIIRHYLADMAGHAAAATAAADLAATHFHDPDPAAAAIAKIRCGESASAVTALAHQIHGAMGFTAEHPLHRYSTRLWSWRDEFGHEAQWSRTLGQAAVAAGTGGVWPWLTALD